MVTENPNIMNRGQMSSASEIGGGRETLHEILTKVNNAKDKTKKIAVLRQYDSEPLRMIIKGSFDPNISWDLPEGTPPYMENEAPLGTEHTYLETEAKRLYHFVKGADDSLSKTRKETLFIQMLEGLHSTEAKLLLDIKDKVLHRKYKGLSVAVVKEAFNWNDNFTKVEQK